MSLVKVEPFRPARSLVGMVASVVALALLVLGGSPALAATADSPSAAGTTVGNPTLTVWSNPPARAIHPGGSISMTAMVATAGCGSVTLSSIAPIVGTRVIDLWAHTPGHSWARVATRSYAYLGAQGALFTYRPVAPVTYLQARYRGVPLREFPSVGPVTTVMVVPIVRGWISDFLGGRLPLGFRYPVSVRVSPLVPSVTLQRHTANGWISVATVLPRLGVYPVRVPVMAGTRQWRLAIPSTRATASTTTGVLTTTFSTVPVRSASVSLYSAPSTMAATWANPPIASTFSVAPSAAEPLVLPTSATWVSTVAEHPTQTEICGGQAITGAWVVRTSWVLHGGTYEDVLTGEAVRGTDHPYVDNQYRSPTYTPSNGCEPGLLFRLRPIGSTSMADDVDYRDMGSAGNLFWPSCPTT